MDVDRCDGVHRSISPTSSSSSWIDELDAELDQQEEVFAMEDDSEGDSDQDDDDIENDDYSNADDQDSDTSDITQEMKRYLKKMPGLRKKLSAFEEEEEQDPSDQEDEEDVDVMAWGKRKNLYYNDDGDLDDEAADEEEREAMRLQKERVLAMTENDFMDGFEVDAHDDDDSLGARAASRGNDSNSNNNKKKNKALEDVNEELDAIDLKYDLWRGNGGG